MKTFAYIVVLLGLLTAGCAGGGYPLEVPDPGAVVAPDGRVQPLAAIGDVRRYRLAEAEASRVAGRPVVELTTGPVVRFVNWNDTPDPDGLELTVLALNAGADAVPLPPGRLVVTLLGDTGDPAAGPGHAAPLQRRGEPVLQWTLTHQQLKDFHRETFLLGHSYPLKLGVGAVELWAVRDGARVARHYVVETRYLAADGRTLIHLDTAVPYVPYELK